MQQMAPCIASLLTVHPQSNSTAAMAAKIPVHQLKVKGDCEA
jgi:hypothetical protein